MKVVKYAENGVLKTDQFTDGSLFFAGKNGKEFILLELSGKELSVFNYTLDNENLRCWLANNVEKHTDSNVLFYEENGKKYLLINNTSLNSSNEITTVFLLVEYSEVND